MSKNNSLQNLELNKFNKRNLSMDKIVNDMCKTRKKATLNGSYNHIANIFTDKQWCKKGSFWHKPLP
jgi:hypothetical protein